MNVLTQPLANLNAFADPVGDETPFRSGAMAKALEGLASIHESRTAVTVITGPIGSGKTCLVRAHFAQLTDGTETAFLCGMRKGETDVLPWIRHAFALGSEDDTEPHAFLTKLHERDCSAVLAVDEAQHLNRDTVGQIVRLAMTEPALCVILIGWASRPGDTTISTDATRAEPVIRLELFNREETRSFLAYQLERAGLAPGYFSAEHADWIHNATGGNPRLINVLGSRAVQMAAKPDGDAFGKNDFDRLVQGFRSARSLIPIDLSALSKGATGTAPSHGPETWTEMAKAAVDVPGRPTRRTGPKYDPKPGTMDAAQVLHGAHPPEAKEPKTDTAIPDREETTRVVAPTPNAPERSHPMAGVVLPTLPESIVERLDAKPGEQEKTEARVPNSADKALVDEDNEIIPKPEPTPVLPDASDFDDGADAGTPRDEGSDLLDPLGDRSTLENDLAQFHPTVISSGFGSDEPRNSQRSAIAGLVLALLLSMGLMTAYVMLTRPDGTLPPDPSRDANQIVRADPTPDADPAIASPSETRSVVPPAVDGADETADPPAVKPAPTGPDVTEETGPDRASEPDIATSSADDLPAAPVVEPRIADEIDVETPPDLGPAAPETAISPRPRALSYRYAFEAGRADLDTLTAAVSGQEISDTIWVTSSSVIEGGNEIIISYFHDADQAGANAIVSTLRARFPDGPPIDLRDYRGFLPSPKVGTLEIHIRR